jgi:hypothetical protein
MENIVSTLPEFKLEVIRKVLERAKDDYPKDESIQILANSLLKIIK